MRKVGCENKKQPKNGGYVDEVWKTQLEKRQKTKEENVPGFCSARAPEKIQPETNCLTQLWMINILICADQLNIQLTTTTRKNSQKKI